MTGYVRLMIDGDHAIALLGDDLQSGQSVCVQVEEVAGSRYTPDAQRRAALKALQELQTKLEQPNLGYSLDASHPDFS